MNTVSVRWCTRIASPLNALQRQRQDEKQKYQSRLEQSILGSQDTPGLLREVSRSTCLSFYLARSFSSSLLSLLSCFLFSSSRMHPLRCLKNKKCVCVLLSSSALPSFIGLCVICSHCSCLWSSELFLDRGSLVFGSGLYLYLFPFNPAFQRPIRDFNVGALWCTTAALRRVTLDALHDRFTPESAIFFHMCLWGGWLKKKAWRQCLMFANIGFASDDVCCVVQRL